MTNEVIVASSENLLNKLPKIVFSLLLSVFEASKSEIIFCSSLRFNFFISSINLLIFSLYILVELSSIEKLLLFETFPKIPLKF